MHTPDSQQIFPTIPAAALALTPSRRAGGSRVRRKNSLLTMFALAGLVSVAALPTVHAQNGTWTNDASGNWNDPVNWLNATVAEGTSAVANFSTIDITASRTVTLDAAHTIGALVFGDTSGTDGWLVTSNASDFALTLAVSSGSPTITVNNNAATNAIVLSGTQGFVKLGGGSLTLSGNPNNYSGQTVVSNGTLVLQKPSGANAIPGDLSIYGTVTQISDNQIANSATLSVNSGGIYNPKTETVDTLVLNGGTINQSSTETLIVNTLDARSGTIQQNVGGTGKIDGNLLTKSTPGTVTISSRGSSASAGGLTNVVVNDGTLIFDYVQNSKLNDSGALTVNGGILMFTNFTSSETVGAVVLAGGVMTNTSGTIDLRVTNGGSFDVRSGAVYVVLGGGSGRSLIKTTPGTVILAADNSYSGGTTISQGTLQIGDGGATGLSGTTSQPITNNGSLVFNRSGTMGNISGVISGSGNITKLGSGSISFTAVNTYSGATTISNGTINVSGTATLGDGTGTLTLAGGSLNTTASRNITLAPISNPINLTADSAITTSSTATTVDLNLTNNSISGSAGTLSFRNDGADGAGDVFDVRFSGGSFTFGRPIILTNNGSFGSTRLSSFNTTGTTQTFDGAISGNGNFRRSASVAATGGVTILNAANTYTGTTAVNDGTLLVNGSLGAGAVTVSGASGFAGTLGGNGTINGPVTIQSGGTLSPGASIGRLTISNSLTFLTGSTNRVEVNKTAGTNDVVRGLTAVAYAGTLVVDNLSGTLAVNDSFPIFSAASPSGNFTSIIGSPGLNLAWSFNPATGILSVISTGTPTFNPPVVVSGSVVVTGTGFTPNGTYSWLTSTNVAAPFSAWTTNNTGTFNGSGALSNAVLINPGQPARFFMLKTP